MKTKTAKREWFIHAVRWTTKTVDRLHAVPECDLDDWVKYLNGQKDCLLWTFRRNNDGTVTTKSTWKVNR